MIEDDIADFAKKVGAEEVSFGILLSAKVMNDSILYKNIILGYRVINCNDAESAKALKGIE